MALVTDSDRPQPLWQLPPTACLGASGAASEVPSLLMQPWVWVSVWAILRGGNRTKWRSAGGLGHLGIGLEPRSPRYGPILVWGRLRCPGPKRSFWGASWVIPGALRGVRRCDGGRERGAKSRAVYRVRWGPGVTGLCGHSPLGHGVGLCGGVPVIVWGSVRVGLHGCWTGGPQAVGRKGGRTVSGGGAAGAGAVRGGARARTARRGH